MFEINNSDFYQFVLNTQAWEQKFFTLWRKWKWEECVSACVSEREEEGEREREKGKEAIKYGWHINKER